MIEPQVDELSEHEIEWVTSQLAVARRLVEHYTGSSERLPGPEALDATLAAWLADAPEGRESVDAVVNALGLAFGQNLIDSHRMEWVLLSDPRGIAIALRDPATGKRVLPLKLAQLRVVGQGALSFVALAKAAWAELEGARPAPE